MNFLRLIVGCALFSLLLAVGASASPTATDIEKARSAFDALRRISEQDNAELWGMPLYGPMLLVNPQDRTVIANEPDADGLLKDTAGVFIGQLPSEMGIANTAVDWSGKRWCMALLPLPRDEKERNRLIVHESFHRIQDDLGIPLVSPDNNHLDKTDGRILLRLELAALRAAVNSRGDAVRSHVANAILFREQRRSLYDGSDSTETGLERTEGLAEFTGQALCGRTRAETIQHLNESLDGFLKSETFVRSFAYETGALYGYLLRERDPGWQRRLGADEDLADAARRAFEITLPTDLKTSAEAAMTAYHGERIRAEELARAETRREREERLLQRFGGHPVLTLPNLNMNIQFDGKSLYPVEGVGTFYTPLRASAEWGILEADSGAVIAPDWSRIIASTPTDFRATMVSGEGWKLTLKTGWYVTITVDSTDYEIRRRD